MSNLEQEGQGGATEEGGMAGGTEDEGGMGGGSEGGMGGGSQDDEEMGGEAPSDKPVDVGGWEDNEPSTHAGEGGQSDDVA